MEVLTVLRVWLVVVLLLVSVERSGQSEYLHLLVCLLVCRMKLLNRKDRGHFHCFLPELYIFLLQVKDPQTKLRSKTTIDY